VKFKYCCSLRVKKTLIGSTVETVVSGALVVLIKFPTWACAMPAIPSMGEMMRVKPKLSSAVLTAALAFSICPFAVAMAAFAVPI